MYVEVCVYMCIRIVAPPRSFGMVMFGVFFSVLLMLLMLLMFPVTKKHEQVQLRQR